jgi:hypothetical protein
MDTTTTQEYTTSDLGLAAFLICNEAKLKDIDRSDPRRLVFRFENCKPELITHWQTGRGQVSGLTYYNALQMLKREIYNRRAG